MDTSDKPTVPETIATANINPNTPVSTPLPDPITPTTPNASTPGTAPITPTPTSQNPFPDVPKSLGVVELLSEAEQMEYFACEEVVGSGWSAFVQVGLALAQIRDHRLYRVEYHSFEAYCRAKWQYGRRYVNRLISGAKVFTYLGTINALKKPEHETQVQPLVGLTPAQAQLAWERAVEKAGGRKVTERLVKNAVRELQPPSTPPTTPKRIAQATKSEKRHVINAAFGELLLLLSQKTSHAVLTEKVEKLHGHVQALFAPAAPKRTRGAAP